MNGKYDDAVLAAAAAGPYKDWDTFDIANEGVRMQALHDLVAAPAFDAKAADAILAELKGLARSYGYGQADSYLTLVRGMTDDEIEADVPKAIMRDGVFGGAEGDFYFVATDRSGAMLRDVAATGDAAAWIAANDPRTVLREAFSAGAENRREQEPEPGAAPGV